jgi:ribosomal protein L7/L12
VSDAHQGQDLLNHGHRIAQLELKVAELERRLAGADPQQPEEGGLTFASDQQLESDPMAHPRMAEVLASGNTIEAIQLYRELTGAGLSEAKDAVEAQLSGR